MRHRRLTHRAALQWERRKSRLHRQSCVDANPVRRNRDLRRSHENRHGPGKLCRRIPVPVEGGRETTAVGVTLRQERRKSRYEGRGFDTAAGSGRGAACTRGPSLRSGLPSALPRQCVIVDSRTAQLSSGSDPSRDCTGKAASTRIPCVGIATCVAPTKTGTAPGSSAAASQYPWKAAGKPPRSG